MSWLTDLILALCIAIPLHRWVVNFAFIQGRSMLPTLHHRELVLVWRLPYLFRKPRRQEIVICHYPGRKVKWCRWIPQAFVKRIIALPGDVLEFSEGAVLVNGAPLAEPYLSPALCRFQRDRGPITLGPDEYFVMGDHRDRSHDSRSIGPIRHQDIRGRVVCILLPPRRLHRVL